MDDWCCSNDCPSRDVEWNVKKESGSGGQQRRHTKNLTLRKSLQKSIWGVIVFCISRGRLEEKEGMR